MVLCVRSGTLFPPCCSVVDSDLLGLYEFLVFVDERRKRGWRYDVIIVEAWSRFRLTCKVWTWNDFVFTRGRNDFWHFCALIGKFELLLTAIDFRSFHSHPGHKTFPSISQCPKHDKKTHQWLEDLFLFLQLARPDWIQRWRRVNETTTCLCAGNGYFVWIRFPKG